jgi:4-hydroxybenzoate polyprenyltransferase
MLKYLDYLFLIRPVLMPPVWTILLLGHHRSSQLTGESNLPGLVILLVTLLVGAVYVLNQIFDIESDRLNQKLFFLAKGYISKRSATWETVFLNLMSIAPAHLISLRLGLLFTLGMVLGFLYSAPPFAFKNRPFGGLLMNALPYGSLTFLSGWSMNHNLSTEAVFFSLPYMLAVAAIYLNTTVPDIEGDKRVGKITLAVKWGKEKVVIFSSILVLGAIVLSVLTEDIPFLIASAVSFPFFVFSAFSGGERLIILTTKVSILLLSIAAAIFYPWYFAILILGFIGTRFYYKARFNMDYPTLVS